MAARRRALPPVLPWWGWPGPTAPSGPTMGQSRPPRRASSGSALKNSTSKGALMQDTSLWDRGDVPVEVAVGARAARLQRAGPLKGLIVVKGQPRTRAALVHLPGDPGEP